MEIIKKYLNNKIKSIEIIDTMNKIINENNKKIWKYEKNEKNE